MALTGRTPLLALVTGLLLVAAWPGWGAVGVAALLVVALVAVDVALAAPVSTVGLSRSGDTAVRLGEAARVALRVENASRRRLRGLVREAWPPSAGASPPRHRVAVPAGGVAALETALRPTRRGDRRSERVTVRALGPLGLAGRQRTRPAPWAVRVLPPFTSRRHLPSRLARLRELDGRTALMVRGVGTEFDSLREYVEGDDVRSIDWRATARAADVVVRTWRPERDRHVLLVLDTGRTSAGRVGDAPRLDACLDAALLLAALATRAGDRVDLLAYDRRVRVEVRRAAPSAVLPSFVGAMAGLEPELVETDHRSLVPAVLARAGRRSLVVLLTGLDAAPIEEGLLPLLSALTRRHTVVVASVADPRVVEMAGGRGDVVSVYDAAAAEQTRADRTRVAALLERRGVVVVEAPPAELPPLLADTYLALKAARRL